VELIDIKRDKKTQNKPIETSGSEGYSYGTRLHLTNEEIEKIPSLALLKGGETVKIEAEAKVVGISITEDQDGTERRSVELQITKMGCAANKPLEKMSPKEYREARGK